MHDQREMSQATLVALGYKFILLNCEHGDWDKGNTWLNKMNFTNADLAVVTAVKCICYLSKAEISTEP